MGPSDETPPRLTIALDPTTHRLLTRTAELEDRDYRRGVPGARHVTVEQLAADWLRTVFRTLMPQSYRDGVDGETEEGLIALGADFPPDDPTDN